MWGFYVIPTSVTRRNPYNETKKKGLLNKGLDVDA